MADKTQYLMYKQKPLVKCGNVIYYGSMADEYVIMMQIIDQRKLGDIEVADKIIVKLMLTDETSNPLERIVKTSEKRGLYLALDLASIWLADALKVDA